jgi:hypothetical protein
VPERTAITRAAPTPDQPADQADRVRILTLATWAGLFEVDMKIVGPAELRDAVARLARRYAAVVTDPPLRRS